MSDKAFLAWIYERLKYVHCDDPHADFMNKLQAIIRRTPEDQYTPNV